jgi:hypothetical protein
MTLCSDVVEYHHFGGPCLHLLGAVNGAGKGAQKQAGSIKGEQSLCQLTGNRKNSQKLVVGEEQGAVPNWATTGTNRTAVLNNMEQTWKATLFKVNYLPIGLHKLYHS